MIAIRRTPAERDTLARELGHASAAAIPMPAGDVNAVLSILLAADFPAAPSSAARVACRCGDGSCVLCDDDGTVPADGECNECGSSDHFDGCSKVSR